LWDANGPFFLDFDDFTIGPPVQDLWLVVPGRDEEAQARRRLLVEAYEDMADFDRRSLALIEPLRALRIVRYAAWIAARYEDPAFQRAFPDFRDEAYWQRELATVLELDEIIVALPSAM
jgi:Ser/Thr protein kinase RdoA (MazF antagonist)